MGRPKTFIPCYVCFKEFGSRSIELHEPKCLERWRSANKSLSACKRSTTPVKPADRRDKQEVSVCPNSHSTLIHHQHLSSCGGHARLGSIAVDTSPKMTGVAVKSDCSAKKGKENKNSSNQAPLPGVVGAKNAKNLADPAKLKSIDGNPKQQIEEGSTPDETSSTSRRSVRPQTKILRRPTPNLKHPVIQLDSDDSSGGDISCSSDKSKEENPKRLKTAVDPQDLAQKPKNFIMYNKYNVEKNTKHVANKERTSANSVAPSIPNPCNSCSRSQAPERLHSHAKRDARGLMFRKSPSLDLKTTSPQKKISPLPNRGKNKSKEDSSDSQDSSVCEKEQTVPADDSSASEGMDGKDCPDAPSVEVDLAPESNGPEEEVGDELKSCYICHREIQPNQLLLHESKCLEHWKRANNSLTPNLRQLPPQRPKQQEFRDFESDTDSSDLVWSVVQSQLVPCDLCGRTFFPERLPIHRRVCKGKTSPRPLKRAASLREQPTTPPGVEGVEEEASTAVYVPCSVCDRSYGSWVITIHEQQCVRRQKTIPDLESRNDEVELEPGMRLEETGDDDVPSLTELGDTAWASHLLQLVPCPSCSRTFFPDRLDVHTRICKGSSCGRRPRSNRGA